MPTTHFTSPKTAAFVNSFSVQSQESIVCSLMFWGEWEDICIIVLQMLFSVYSSMYCVSCNIELLIVARYPTY